MFMSLNEAATRSRVVDGSGKIRTIVGTGEKGASGDGGDALKATVNGPKHLCVDSQDNVIIADTENHMIANTCRARKNRPVGEMAGAGQADSAGRRRKLN